MHRDAIPMFEAGADRMRLIGARRRAWWDDAQDVYNAWSMLLHTPSGQIVYKGSRLRGEALCDLMRALFEQLRLLKEDESVPLASAHEEALRIVADKADKLAAAARLEAPE